MLLCSAALWGAQEARRAPSFSLPDVNGRQYDLLDYRGRIVLVEFMRTNCPHCAAFSKVLDGIKSYYKDKVVVLGIATSPDNPTTVNEFVSKGKVTYPIVMDCGQVAYSYIQPSPLRPSIGIPHVYVVDAAGMIRSDYEFGPQTSEVFQGRGLYTEIDKLLNAKPAAGKK